MLLQGDQTAFARGQKYDATIGQVGWGDIVLAVLGSFVNDTRRAGIGHAPEIFAIEPDLVNAGIALGLAFEAEQQPLRIPRKFGMAVHAAARRVRRGGINDRADAPLASRRGRILQNVNAAAARRPFVVGVVNVNARVGMALDEKERRVEQALEFCFRSGGGGFFGRFCDRSQSDPA